MCSSHPHSSRLTRLQLPSCPHKFTSDENKADREIVWAAVNCVGRSLEFACRELRADFDIVFAAVTNDGEALRFAADELQVNICTNFPMELPYLVSLDCESV